MILLKNELGRIISLACLYVCGSRLSVVSAVSVFLFEMPNASERRLMLLFHCSIRTTLAKQNITGLVTT